MMVEGEENMNTAGWCGAAYIFGCRKFSAFVNGQNDRFSPR